MFRIVASLSSDFHKSSPNFYSASSRGRYEEMAAASLRSEVLRAKIFEDHVFFRIIAVDIASNSISMTRSSD